MEKIKCVIVVRFYKLKNGFYFKKHHLGYPVWRKHLDESKHRWRKLIQSFIRAHWLTASDAARRKMSLKTMGRETAVKLYEYCWLQSGKNLCKSVVKTAEKRVCKTEHLQQKKGKWMKLVFVDMTCNSSNFKNVQVFRRRNFFKTVQ